ncbi:MAG: hypothetical protein ACRDFB_09875 [Rhabdochlamydiaceae bacterium]
MQRGTIIMIAGLLVQVINWIFSATSSQLSGFSPDGINSIKGILGYVTIVGWLVFFAGFGIRQLDKKKSSLNDPKRKKRL